MSQVTLAPEWARAIDQWMLYLGAGGAPKTTCRLRRQHLSQLARAGVEDPWAIVEGDLLNWLNSGTWAAETRHSMRTSVRVFYEWAARTGRVSVDPARFLPRVRRPGPRPRPVPEPHYVVALAAAGEREALMLRLAGGHGLRRAEIAQVHRRDVFEDLLGYSLVVHGKGGKERTVPLADDVAEALLAVSGYAFPGKVNGHLSAQWVGDLLARQLPAGWTGHKLRHRFATQTYAENQNVYAVQDLLGHSSSDTTRRYVQVSSDAGRLLVQAVAV